jgi:hypothetical protein
VRRILACTLFALFAAQVVSAEVTLTERKTLHQQLDQTGKTKPEHTRRSAGPGKATGSQALIDASGLKYFINTNITFSTSSSASGAMSEASYTAAVAATTLNGGTTSSTLNDAFDGYGALCVGLNGMTGPCVSNGEGQGIVARAPRVTGKALPDYVMYNQNGPATTDCNGRQIDFPVQTIDLGTTTINLSRKVFVPANDTFARTLNTVTNTGSAAATFNLITSNNLGSDDNTKIVTSSNGNNTAETTDFWITSFQNYSGTTSSDVRLGHVIQGPGATTPVSFIHFLDGTVQPDEPYWGYTITLNPGQTKIIMTFVTGQPSNAASAAKSAQIAGLPTNTLQCLTPAEEAAIVNFAAAANLIPTLGNLGLAVLCLALAGFAMMRLRRRTA